MCHLKHLLFGIILLSSFGSAFADGYDPSQDVFDQIINALVPTLIVFLNFKGADEEKLKNISINVTTQGDTEQQQNDVEKQGWKTRLKSKFNKIRQILLPVKIKRAFDDFLFLLSLFILPSIVFHKNHEIPLWISILSGVAAGIIFIITIYSYIFWHTEHSPNFSDHDLMFYTAVVIDLSHILSDICFLFYTQSLPASNFTDGFIYAHAVTGFLGALFLLGVIINHFLYMIYNLNDDYNVFDFLLCISGIFLIPITLLWTPIIQMLNMALLSGNDYYWTKLILAINLIYLSRVLYYAIDKNFKKLKENRCLDKAEMFGLLNIIFYARHITYMDGIKIIQNFIDSE